MCMGTALKSYPTSFACEDQRLTSTSLKVALSSEDFKLRQVSIGESRKLVIWSGGREIKILYSLHCMVALNLHNKPLPKRFADEEPETRKISWVVREPKDFAVA